MEFVAGQELRHLINSPIEGGAALAAGGVVPLPDVLDYATQIAQGLQAAHKKGIVHRDIKPANIMVTDDGLVKVMDFDWQK